MRLRVASEENNYLTSLVLLYMSDVRKSGIFLC